MNCGKHPKPIVAPCRRKAATLKGESMTEGPQNCTTHHHACDCRERKLLAVLKPHMTELKLEGLRGNQVAFQAFVDVDETWRELYGCSIEDDER
jgi:hypothetical protein